MFGVQVEMRQASRFMRTLLPPAPSTRPDGAPDRPPLPHPKSDASSARVNADTTLPDFNLVELRRCLPQMTRSLRPGLPELSTMSALRDNCRVGLALDSQTPTRVSATLVGRLRIAANAAACRPCTATRKFCLCDVSGMHSHPATCPEPIAGLTVCPADVQRGLGASLDRDSYSVFSNSFHSLRR